MVTEAILSADAEPKHLNEIGEALGSMFIPCLNITYTIGALEMTSHRCRDRANIKERVLSQKVLFTMFIYAT